MDLANVTFKGLSVRSEQSEREEAATGLTTPIRSEAAEVSKKKEGGEKGSGFLGHEDTDPDLR